MVCTGKVVWGGIQAGTEDTEGEQRVQGYADRYGLTVRHLTPPDTDGASLPTAAMPVHDEKGHELM